ARGNGPCAPRRGVGRQDGGSFGVCLPGGREPKRQWQRRGSRSAGHYAETADTIRLAAANALRSLGAFVFVFVLFFVLVFFEVLEVLVVEIVEILVLIEILVELVIEIFVVFEVVFFVLVLFFVFILGFVCILVAANGQRRRFIRRRDPRQPPR